MSVKEQYWKYSLITIILGLGLILFIKMSPFMGGILGAHLHYGKKTNVLSYPRKAFQKKHYSHFTLDRSYYVLSCTFIIGRMVIDQ